MRFQLIRGLSYILLYLGIQLENICTDNHGTGTRFFACAAHACIKYIIMYYRMQEIICHLRRVFRVLYLVVFLVWLKYPLLSRGFKNESALLFQGYWLKVEKV